MKKLIYTLFALAALLFVSCAEVQEKSEAKSNVLRYKIEGTASRTISPDVKSIVSSVSTWNLEMEDSTYEGSSKISDDDVYLYFEVQTNDSSSVDIVVTGYDDSKREIVKANAKSDSTYLLIYPVESEVEKTSSSDVNTSSNSISTSGSDSSDILYGTLIIKGSTTEDIDLGLDVSPAVSESDGTYTLTYEQVPTGFYQLKSSSENENLVGDTLVAIYSGLTTTYEFNSNVSNVGVLYVKNSATEEGLGSYLSPFTTQQFVTHFTQFENATYCFLDSIEITDELEITDVSLRKSVFCIPADRDITFDLNGNSILVNSLPTYTETYNDNDGSEKELNVYTALFYVDGSSADDNPSLTVKNGSITIARPLTDKTVSDNTFKSSDFIVANGGNITFSNVDIKNIILNSDSSLINASAIYTETDDAGNINIDRQSVINLENSTIEVSYMYTGGNYELINLYGSVLNLTSSSIKIDNGSKCYAVSSPNEVGKTISPESSKSKLVIKSNDCEVTGVVTSLVEKAEGIGSLSQSITLKPSIETLDPVQVVLGNYYEGDFAPRSGYHFASSDSKCLLPDQSFKWYINTENETSTDSGFGADFVCKALSVASDKVFSGISYARDFDTAFDSDGVLYAVSVKEQATSGASAEYNIFAGQSNEGGVHKTINNLTSNINYGILITPIDRDNVVILVDSKFYLVPIDSSEETVEATEITVSEELNISDSLEKATALTAYKENDNTYLIYSYYVNREWPNKIYVSKLLLSDRTITSEEWKKELVGGYSAATDERADNFSYSARITDLVYVDGSLYGLLGDATVSALNGIALPAEMAYTTIVTSEEEKKYFSNMRGALLLLGDMFNPSGDADATLYLNDTAWAFGYMNSGNTTTNYQTSLDSAEVNVSIYASTNSDYSDSFFTYPSFFTAILPKKLVISDTGAYWSSDNGGEFKRKIGEVEYSLSEHDLSFTDKTSDYQTDGTTVYYGFGANGSISQKAYSGLTGMLYTDR